MKLNRQQKMLIALVIGLGLAWQLGWVNLGQQFFGRSDVTEWGVGSCVIDAASQTISCTNSGTTGFTPATGFKVVHGAFMNGIVIRDGPYGACTSSLCASLGGNDPWTNMQASPRTVLLVFEQDVDENLGTADRMTVNAVLSGGITMPCLDMKCYTKGIGQYLDGVPFSSGQVRIKSFSVYYGSGSPPVTTTVPGTTTTIPNPPVLDLVGIINSLFDSIFNVIRNLLGWLQIA